MSDEDPTPELDKAIEDAEVFLSEQPCAVMGSGGWATVGGLPFALFKVGFPARWTLMLGRVQGPDVALRESDGVGVAGTAEKKLIAQAVPEFYAILQKAYERSGGSQADVAARLRRFIHDVGEDS